MIVCQIIQCLEKSDIIWEVQGVLEKTDAILWFNDVTNSRSN